MSRLGRGAAPRCGSRPTSLPHLQVGGEMGADGPDPHDQAVRHRARRHRAAARPAATCSSTASPTTRSSTPPTPRPPIRRLRRGGGRPAGQLRQRARPDRAHVPKGSRSSTSAAGSASCSPSPRTAGGRSASASSRPTSRRASPASAGLDVRQRSCHRRPAARPLRRASCMGDVLEHLTDTNDALARMPSSSRPGGVLVLALPDAGSRIARLLGKRLVVGDPDPRPLLHPRQRRRRCSPNGVRAARDRHRPQVVHDRVLPRQGQRLPARGVASPDRLRPGLGSPTACGPPTSGIGFC